MYSNLKFIRKDRNVSAKKMCQIIGLSTTSAYYKKETGAVKFTLDEAREIAIYFRKPIEDIFFKTNSS